MANMSYCRFSNTLEDLKDCYDNMDAEGLSYAERMARWRIVRMCMQIAADYEDEGSLESKPTPEGVS